MSMFRLAELVILLSFDDAKVQTYWQAAMNYGHKSAKNTSLFDLCQLVVCEHSDFVLAHSNKTTIRCTIFGKLFISLQQDNDRS